MIDTISRQQAVDFVGSMNMCDEISNEAYKKLTSYLDELPSAQPDIIRCKDCKHYKYGICMKIGANKSFHGFCDWAERGEQDE